MKIAIVASEAIPFSKTGGLADVTGTLFREFLKMGLDTYLFLPLYKKTLQEFKANIEESLIELDISLGKYTKRCKIFRYTKSDFFKSKSGAKKNIFFISNEEFFDRNELYGEWFGEYSDNAARFTFFCKSVLDLIRELKIKFDIIHCHDWQTGLIPLYLKTTYKDSEILRDTHTVFTIHNIAYQGLFPPDTLDITGLGHEFFHIEGIEFYGNISYLKAGIISADIITTVSDSYAKEITTQEFGFSMDGILRKRADSLYGIVNGIDYKEWDPARDPYIPSRYSRTDIACKRENKEELLKRCSLGIDINSPLLCFIGRLSYQKGIDLLIAALDDSIMNIAGVIIIGKGQIEYHEPLSFLQQRFANKIFFYNGFDESLAHLSYAGSDIFLMPSRYEPCGLGQMIAMRYGTIPVARKTGGLSDLIEDGVTGFLFEDFSKEAFSISIKIALNTYKFKKLWLEMIKEAMGRDFSWNKSAKKYLSLYSNLLN